MGITSQGLSADVCERCFIFEGALWLFEQRCEVRRSSLCIMGAPQDREGRGGSQTHWSGMARRQSTRPGRLVERRPGLASCSAACSFRSLPLSSCTNTLWFYPGGLGRLTFQTLRQEAFAVAAVGMRGLSCASLQLGSCTHEPPIAARRSLSCI